MKYVAKGKAPRELTKWLADNRDLLETLEWDAGSLPKAAIRRALLAEQGWLCAYTMLRIEADECHIEHLLPRALHPASVFDFRNMLACFPANGGATHFGYGAPLKGNAGIHSNSFVFPTDAACEGSFRYQKDGTIEGNTEAAKQTIKLLGLNHRSLVDRRALALSARGLTTSLTSRRRMKIKRLSQKAAQDLAKLMQLKDTNGRFFPFCAMIAQFARNFSIKAEARSTRLRSQRPDA